MCIGVPGQIRTIDGNQAKVDVCGIQRDVDLTLVGSCDENGQPRVGQWVLVHVGFAMSVINEAEARDTLDALQNMFDVEPDVGECWCETCQQYVTLLTQRVRRCPQCHGDMLQIVADDGLQIRRIEIDQE